MKLAELITEKVIVLNFKAKDKWEAIDRLLDHIKTVGSITQEQYEPVRSALIARENIASTGLEHGVALPHATVDALSVPVAALALSEEGVPFQTTDGKPAKIVILIAIPRQTQRMYISTLAGIARLLNYEEMRNALSSAKSAKEVVRIIADEEAKEPAK